MNRLVSAARSSCFRSLCSASTVTEASANVLRAAAEGRAAATAQAAVQQTRVHETFGSTDSDAPTDFVFVKGEVPDVNAELSESVRRVLSLDSALQPERNRHDLQQAVKDWQRHDRDTGSAEVQVAVLTKRVLYLTEHMKKNRKDFHTLRSLHRLVSKRSRMLRYLERRDRAKHREMMKTLLKK